MARVTFTKAEANRCIKDADSLNQYGKCLSKVLKGKKRGRKRR